MLVPNIEFKVYTTKRTFPKAYDRAIHIRDNGHDRVISWRGVTKFTTTESFDKITQEGKIIIPRDARYSFLKPSGEGFKTVYSADADTGHLFNVGDMVTVSVNMDQSTGQGYEHGEKNIIFRGYISSIDPSDNLILEVQDEMWLLKQKKATVTFGQQSILSIVKEICKGVIDEANISGGYLEEESQANFIVSGYRLRAQPTLAQALYALRKHFGVRCWFRNEFEDGSELPTAKLYVGRRYYEAQRINHNYRFQTNIISDNLKFRKKDDYLRGVKVININPADNSRTEIYEGDEFGDVKTMHVENMTESQMREIAKHELDSLSYDGFYGNFTCFLAPVMTHKKLAKHGDTVTIKDPRFKEREGIYIVSEITRTYDSTGAFQKISIHKRVDV